MNNDKNKLAIAYRIYPKISKVPAIHSDNKYNLSELCLSSFKDSLEGIDYKMWVLLDNCPSEYTNLFLKYFPKDRLEFINLSGIGNGNSFAKQIEILLSQNFSENIYFAEDDYYYLPNAIKEMLDLINNYSNIDFLTSYDHLDYYNTKFHNYKSKIITSKNYHWRDSASTCLTFMTTKNILNKSKSTFLTYKRKNYDGSVWISLTKFAIFNPIKYIYALFSDTELLKIFVKAWWHSHRQILFGKKYKLWSPMPSLSTHLDSEFLAPLVDWKKIWNKEK
jgi:hypothetical protein